MNRAQTRVHRKTHSRTAASQYRTAFSLHSHTNHSKEALDFLPRYIEFHKIPVLSRLVHSELKRYEESNGKTIDFHRAYWTPPVNPQMVLASETSQIEEKLGLAAIVSITDHDTIAGPLSLHTQSGLATLPISVEWTVPYAGNTFHMGVHGLPLSRAADMMERLRHSTANPVEEDLSELFADLDRLSETLLVFNHPCCNFVNVAAEKHWSSLRKFVAQCRPWIHAVEVNGMRPWKENQDALRLAEEYDLPVVAGGDRHGCRPNTMLNLSRAGTWSEFVAQIRCDRCSDVLVMPAYEEPVRWRELATAADVLRRYPHHPYGQRRFTDRVFAEVEGYSWHPLSYYWDGGNGVPRWLQPIVMTVLAAGSNQVRPVLRQFLSWRGPDYSSEASRTLTEH